MQNLFVIHHVNRRNDVIKINYILRYVELQLIKKKSVQICFSEEKNRCDAAISFVK